MKTTAYHGTPITPNSVLEMLGPRAYCVSFYAPQQIAMVAAQSSEFMIDNGAFSAWKASDKRLKVGLEPMIFDADYWARYYDFCRKWLNRPQDWFVIPDVINAGTQEQDALLRDCPPDLRDRGAPVWHMDEPIWRLMSLLDRFPRVCIGSTAEYRTVLSPAWIARMDEIWDEVTKVYPTPPDLHMLRGLQLLKPDCPWPFRRVDSTNLARNHNRLNRYGPRKLWALEQIANAWDARTCPASWLRPQLELFEAA